ncbi:riboflavin kinase, partial [Streptococcus agalactiae]
LKRIREMVKFNGIDDLVKQLKKDKEIALNWKKDSQTL